MRPKPTQKKQKKPDASIILYKGYNIHTACCPVMVFHAIDGREFWDSGFQTVEDAKFEIDQTVDGECSEQ
jgi:hypothetical protein